MFNRLHNFAVVVEQMSLNRASRLLNLSQPALSRHIRGLEEELGAALFNRIGKRLELTPMGQLLYDYSQEERRLERQFQQSADKFRNAARGSITIGASLTTLQSTLPDLLAHFYRTDPGADLKAITGKTHEIVALVKNRKADVGLVASALQEPGLVCAPLFDDHLCLVAPRLHALALKSAITIGDLNEQPMILFSKGTWYRILTDDLFERFRIRPEIKMEIDSFEAIVRLLSTGHTVTLLPKSYLRPSLLEDNQLVRIDISELKKTVRTTALVYSSEQQLSRATQRFVTNSRLYYAR